MFAIQFDNLFVLWKIPLYKEDIWIWKKISNIDDLAHNFL